METWTVPSTAPNILTVPVQVPASDVSLDVVYPVRCEFVGKVLSLDTVGILNVDRLCCFNLVWNKN